MTPSAERPLELTKEGLLRILSYHQVMPTFLDFLFAYGSQYRKREARLSGFRIHSTLFSKTISVDGLGRSDKRFQMSYNIKSLIRFDRSKSLEDALWHVAVHHQFDARTWKQVWIFGDPHADLKKATQLKYNAKYEPYLQFDDVQRSFSSMVSSGV